MLKRLRTIYSATSIFLALSSQVALAEVAIIENLIEVFLVEQKLNFIKTSVVNDSIEPSRSQPGQWYYVEQQNNNNPKNVTYLLVVSTPYGGTMINNKSAVAGIIVQVNQQRYICPPEPFPFEVDSGSIYLLPLWHSSDPIIPPLSPETIHNFSNNLNNFLAKNGYTLNPELTPFMRTYTCEK